MLRVVSVSCMLCGISIGVEYEDKKMTAEEARDYRRKIIKEHQELLKEHIKLDHPQTKTNDDAIITFAQDTDFVDVSREPEKAYIA